MVGGRRWWCGFSTGQVARPSPAGPHGSVSYLGPCTMTMSSNGGVLCKARKIKPGLTSQSCHLVLLSPIFQPPPLNKLHPAAPCSVPGTCSRLQPRSTGRQQLHDGLLYSAPRSCLCRAASLSSLHQSCWAAHHRFRCRLEWSETHLRMTARPAVLYPYQPSSIETLSHSGQISTWTLPVSVCSSLSPAIMVD